MKIIEGVVVGRHSQNQPDSEDTPEMAEAWDRYMSAKEEHGSGLDSEPVWDAFYAWLTLYPRS